jgi:methyl-CpG-binding domain protein 4
MLLNKTAGRVAVPILWTLITRWPTPESLAKGQHVFSRYLSSLIFEAGGHVSLTLTADPVELEDCIRCLGLQSIRARRLISLSAAYLEQRDHNKQRQPESQNLPSIAISHLPGSGPYALDSYRIYCGGPDDWRAVVPHDKELIRFIVCIFFFDLKVIRYHI